MQMWAIIVDSFRDAIDRKIFWIMLLIGVVIAATMACIGFDEKGVNVLFGWWTYEAREWSIASDELRDNVAAVAVELLADNYLGWIGMIVALVATATTFPSLMAPGHIDIVASKPLSRNMLFVGRYLGAMVFIFLQAVVFVGLTFCVMGLRWHVWVWGYLWVVPLMLLLFSYLFAFCALFGVWTQRSMTSLMLTMVVWFFLYSVQTAHALLVTQPEIDPSGRWTRMMAVAHWAVPKTQDIPIIASKLVGASMLVDMIPVNTYQMPQHEREGFKQVVKGHKRIVAAVDPLASITSSLAAEAVVVLLAMWRFNRRDF